MNLGMAVHNAPTDHGGFIPSTLKDRSSVMGQQFVRAGDGHFCPKCKVWSVVKPSHDHVIFDGQPVAYVNDELTCGARITEQQTHTVGNSREIGFRNGYSSSDFLSSFSYESKREVFDEQIQVKSGSGESILEGLGYRLKLGNQPIEGFFDAEGKTMRFQTNQPLEITEFEIFFPDDIKKFSDLEGED